MPKLSRSEPTTVSSRLQVPSRVRAGAIAVALLAGLGAAGCGSSSHSSASTAPAAITKAEFVAKANAICGSADPELSAGTAKLATIRSEPEVAAIVRGVFVPAIEAQITHIRALGTPPGDQATVASMLKLALTDLGKLKSNPALVDGDAFADFAKVAHPYGLTACAPTS